MKKRLIDLSHEIADGLVTYPVCPHQSYVTFSAVSNRGNTMHAALQKFDRYTFPA
jgi:kynurenine formamidase